MSPADNSSETGQISVAELLARNGRETGTSGTSGGRRRRGEAGGGISVSDLTGEIPVIRDATRHRRAAEPDDDEQEIAAPAAPVATTPAAPPKPAPEPAPDTSAGTSDDTVHAWSAVEREPQLLSGSTVASEYLRNSIEATRDDSDAPVAPAPRVEPVKSPEAAKASPAPAPAAPEVPPAQPKSERRLIRKEFPVVDVPAWALTGNIDVAGARGLGRKSPAQPVADGERETDLSDDHESDYLDSDYLEADGIEPEIDAEIDADLDFDDEIEVDDDEQLDGEAHAPIRQWLALAAEAVVALVVGGLLFKGFERLWDSMPWVALVLSVMVILGLVALVRVVRRTDDILSFVIAIVVGIFVTIGPLAFLLSTG